MSTLGKHHSAETKRKLSEAKKGKHLSEETKRKISITQKISESKKGINNPMFGKKGKNNPNYGKKVSQETKRKISKALSGKQFSAETKRKMRKSAINRIEKCKFNGNQLTPAYNPNSIPVIEQYGKENGYNFQHAENGGEHYIKELGYWVDGYDKDKNIVIEYYEKYHNKRKEKDKLRKEEIINYLNCKFIELYEDNKLLEN